VTISPSRPWVDRPRHTVAAIAALLALYALVHLALLWRFPWFVDETFFASFAQTVQGDPSQRFIALTDHKGLIVTWLGAVLVRLDVPPVEAMRLISIASGAVAAAATGFIAWRWWSPRFAIAAAALVAFIPYFFVHASVGIYDPFVAAGCMVALALQLELARRPRLDVALLLGITLGITLLAKPTGALAIALWPASLAVFDWRAPRVRSRLAAWAGLVVLAIFVTLCLWSLSRLSPLAYTPAPENHRTIGDLLADPFGTLSEVAPTMARTLWGYLTPPGLALAIWGLVRVVATRDRVGLVVAAWALAGLAAYLLLTLWAFPRYGLQAVAPLSLLIVIGGDDLWRRARARFGLRRVAAVAAFLALPLVVLDAWVLVSPKDAPYPGVDREQYVSGQANRGPARAAALAIQDRVPDGFEPGTPDAQRTVAQIGGWVWATALTLNGTHLTKKPPFLVVESNADPAVINGARFVILDGKAPPGLSVGEEDLVRTWTRPDGPPVRLYDRGG
jgi:4-amino-4-deoxy-L-arabinose transferase-like glycosyltransferase